MKRYLLASAGVLAMASLLGGAAQAQYVGAQSDQERSDGSSYDRQYDNRSGSNSQDDGAWRDAYDAIYGNGDDRNASQRYSDQGQRAGDQRAQYREPYRWNRADADGFSGTGIDYGGSPYSEMRYSEMRRSAERNMSDRSYQMADRPNDQSSADYFGRDEYSQQNRNAAMNRRSHGRDDAYGSASDDYGRDQYGSRNRWSDDRGYGQDQYGRQARQPGDRYGQGSRDYRAESRSGR